MMGNVQFSQGSYYYGWLGINIWCVAPTPIQSILHLCQVKVTTKKKASKRKMFLAWFCRRISQIRSLQNWHRKCEGKSLFKPAIAKQFFSNFWLLTRVTFFCGPCGAPPKKSMTFNTQSMFRVAKGPISWNGLPKEKVGVKTEHLAIGQFFGGAQPRSAMGVATRCNWSGFSHGVIELPETL